MKTKKTKSAKKLPVIAIAAIIIVVALGFSAQLIMTGVLGGSLVVTVVPLFLILGYIAIRGASAIESRLFTQEQYPPLTNRQFEEYRAWPIEPSDFSGVAATWSCAAAGKPAFSGSRAWNGTEEAESLWMTRFFYCTKAPASGAEPETSSESCWTSPCTSKATSTVLAPSRKGVSG